MDYLRQMWQQIRTVVAGMSLPWKVGTVAAAAGMLLLVVVVAYYSNQHEFQTLYSNLSADDSQPILEKLQAKGVQYRVVGNGGTIKVPSDQVAPLRVELATVGLPSKGKGWELFDIPSFGMTPMEQRVNFDRALSGELSRTLNQIEPIVFARVHVARPEPTAFLLRDQKPTTASVVLKLKPNTSLNSKTARGITALMANSVEGLTPNNVTIMDTYGQQLTQLEGDMPGATGLEVEYRNRLVAMRAQQAEEMLARTLGPGRAVVKVTADVKFSKEVTKKKTFDNDNKALESQKETTRKQNRNNASRGGIAGAGSNLPVAGGGGGPQTTPATNASTEQEDETESKWAVSTVSQDIEQTNDTIERMTIAALVDLSRPEGAEGKSLTLEQAEKIIKQAVGFKNSRDSIEVNDVKLVSLVTDVPPVAIDGGGLAWYMTVARNLSLAGVVLVGLTLAVIFYQRRTQAVAAEQAKFAANEAASKEAEGLGAAARLIALAEENPEGLVKLLTAWLDEEQPVQPREVAQAA